MPGIQSRDRPTLLFYLVWLIFAALYLYTLYPGIGGRINYGDSAKWQFLWQVNGLPHSTGYPLFLQLCELFGNNLTFLPPPMRITAISLIFGLTTLIILYRVLAPVMRHHWLNLLPPLVLGSGYVFWTQSTEAEVYTLNAFLLVTVLLSFIRFLNSQQRGWFYAGVVLFALSLGNHLSMIMLTPALFYAAWVTDRSILRSPRSLATIALILTAGLAQYLYIWWLASNDPPYLEYLRPDPGLIEFLAYISGEQFLGQTQPELMSLGTAYAKLFYYASRDLVVIFMVLPLALPFLKPANDCSSRIVRFLALALIGELFFALHHRVYDNQTYYIPIYILASLLSVLAIDRLATRFMTVVVSTIVVSGAIINTGYHALHLKVSENALSNLARNIVQKLPDNTTIYLPLEKTYGDYDLAEAINYFRLTELKERDIQLIELLPDNGEFFALPVSRAYIASHTHPNYRVQSWKPGTRPELLRVTVE